MDIHYCPVCGTSLPDGARFCPKCGQTVELQPRAAEPASPPPVARVPPPAIEPERGPSAPPPVAKAPSRISARAWTIGVPLTIVVLAILGWAVLQGMPFGSREPKLERTTPQASTIGEGDARTATVARIPDPAGEARDDTAAMPPPNVRTATGVADSVPPTRNAPPISQQIPAASQHPVPVAPQAATTAERPPTRTVIPPAAPVTPAPARERESADRPGPGELSEGGAINRLRQFLSTGNPYDVPFECLDIRSLGYANRGYTLQVMQSECSRSSQPPHALGRWRVDTVTRDVFRQRADGRYLQP